MPSPHPVLRQRGFAVKTPPLAEVVQAFESRRRNGDFCLLAFGPPRVGRTTAMHFIKRQLLTSKAAACRTASFEGAVGGGKTDSTRFWRRFIQESDGRRATWWQSPETARTGLIKSLMTEADAMGSDEIVFIADDAQNLTIPQFQMLRLLLDELVDEGKSPFLLMLAQAEIEVRPDQLLLRDLHDIASRFFLHKVHFRRLKVEEIKIFLAAYDNLKWVPAEGARATTFTEYFSPALACSGGMASLAPYFEPEFSATLRRLRVADSDGVEIDYVARAARIFLLTVKDDPKQLHKAKLQETVRAAVAQSGLYEGRSLVGNANPAVGQKRNEKRKSRLES